jgi:hypothetical protein
MAASQCENRPGGPFILAAGMPRSGSTWLYNLTRLILDDNLTSKEYWSGWIDDFHGDAASASGLSLIKIHEFDADLAASAAAIVYSYRDIRDVLASSQRMWGTPPSVQTAEALVAQFERWIAVCSIALRYDELVACPENAVRRVAAALGFKVDPHSLIGRLHELSFESPGRSACDYHRINLYHRNHVTHGGHGTWQGTVDPRLIEEVEARFAGWFERYGYLPALSLTPRTHRPDE